MPGGGERFYGSPRSFGDLYAFVRANAALLNATNRFVSPPDASAALALNFSSTGSGTDSRWRLPTDTPPVNGTDVPFGAAGLDGCGWACAKDARCVAVFWHTKCFLLYETVVIKNTRVAGNSYTLVGRGGDLRPPFQPDALDVSAVARRAPTHEGDSGQLALNLVDWRHASSAAPQPPLNVSMLNRALHGTDACGGVAMTELRPGTAPRALAGICEGDRTTITLEAPTPWSIVHVTPSRV